MRKIGLLRPGAFATLSPKPGAPPPRTLTLQLRCCLSAAGAHDTNTTNTTRNVSSFWDAPSRQLSDVWKETVRPLSRRANAWWCGTSHFKDLVKQAFSNADVDQSGYLDTAELYVCILRVYERINTSTSTHIQAPKKAAALALMKEFDLDDDGRLSFEEFLACARSMFGVASLRHSVPLNVAAVLLLRIVVLPAAASLVIGCCEAAGGLLSPLALVPLAVYCFGFELLLRQLWTHALG